MLSALGFGSKADPSDPLASPPFLQSLLGKDSKGVETFDLTKVAGGNEGQNATYKVNGLDMESTSNSINVSGYDITLNGTFTDSAVTVSSTNDIGSMVDKIKEFVTKYNEFIGGINEQLKETKYRFLCAFNR